MKSKIRLGNLKHKLHFTLHFLPNEHYYCQVIYTSIDEDDELCNAQNENN